MTSRLVALVAAIYLSATSAAVQGWNREVVYAQRLAELKRAADSRPTDANALVDLAAFYLKPLARRTVEAADAGAGSIVHRSSSTTHRVA